MWLQALFKPILSLSARSTLTLTQHPQLYIGNGNLLKNVTNSVVIDNLSDRRQTSAYINGVLEKVEYLIILNEKLNFDKLTGEVYVGGFVDVSLLPVCGGVWFLRVKLWFWAVY